MDVKITEIPKITDTRGDLIVFLRKRDLKKKDFGQIYFVTFDRAGVIRGNHYHKKMREWFGIVSGTVKVNLQDIKSGKKKELYIDVNDSIYYRLEIGPYIAHKFTSITEAQLLNYTDKEWSKEDSFEYKIN